MNVYKFCLLVALTFVLIAGCADKKEEADKLQQELLQQRTAADSLGDTLGEALASADSTADVSAVPAVPPETVKKMPAKPQGGGYTVQVAGCEDRAYAEHLVEIYLERGYEPYMTTVNIEGQTYYRVRIGAYQTMAEAKLAKEQLKDRYSVNAWVDVLE